MDTTGTAAVPVRMETFGTAAVPAADVGDVPSPPPEERRRGTPARQPARTPAVHIATIGTAAVPVRMETFGTAAVPAADVGAVPAPPPVRMEVRA
jgi:hypothetical protein